MKGVIFNILEEMVIEQAGIEAWNTILIQKPQCSGIYTAAASYEDAELFTLVNAVCEAINKPQEYVVEAFGQFLFSQLAKRYSVFCEQSTNLKHFLKQVDSVIHVEVAKLYADSKLPKFDYDEPDDETLVMYYRSERKLCLLAEGLIRGAASHYNQQITIEHPVCIHKGSDHCKLIIRFH